MAAADSQIISNFQTNDKRQTRLQYLLLQLREQMLDCGTKHRLAFPCASREPLREAAAIPLLSLVVLGALLSFVPFSPLLFISAPEWLSK